VKWAAVIRQTERIPEYVSHAYHMARAGRPGPVVLGLPEDMLAAECEASDAAPARIADSRPAAEIWPSSSAYWGRQRGPC
jgi:acetolactate synthase-1/2/3 large subunit